MAGFTFGWRLALILPFVGSVMLFYLLDGTQVQSILSSLNLGDDSKFTYRPAVSLKQGTIIGRLVDDGTFPEPIEGFLGMPYALPPVGALRFRHAVPTPASNQTVKAFYLGPRSVL